MDLYGGKWIKKAACKVFMSYIEGCQKDMIQALENSHRFRAPGTFQDLHKLCLLYTSLSAILPLFTPAQLSRMRLPMPIFWRKQKHC